MSERLTLTSDLHVEVDGDGPQRVAGCTGVQPPITRAYRFDAVNTGLGKATCIVRARPRVRRTRPSHSRAVQLQWVSLCDFNWIWRRRRYEPRLI